MDRNYLRGTEGYKINDILAVCSYNIRKLIRAILLWLFEERSRGVFTLPFTLIERFNRLYQPV
jgi:IS5 family transposase